MDFSSVPDKMNKSSRATVPADSDHFLNPRGMIGRYREQVRLGAAPPFITLAGIIY